MVVTRFAPSPTTVPDASGKYAGLHLGGARTALFSYLLAKSRGGTFLIRIEDTDRERSTRESESAILESLSWLGIESDLPIVRQSERSEIYQKHLDALLEKGLAYKCYCTVKELEEAREDQKAAKVKTIYDRRCCGKPDQPGVPYVVRFKVPQGSVSWRDEVLGTITVNNSELSDPVLRRSDGTFCFLFVNMIDDALQGVTHVMRGQDGVSHCHAQILLCQALGYHPPCYAHIPFVLGQNRKKLSKREGAPSVLDLREQGFLPEAVVNTLARLGCSYGSKGELEILSMAELVKLFKVESLNKAPAVYDDKKLLNLDGHYIKGYTCEKLAALLPEFLKKAGLSDSEIAGKGSRYLTAVIDTLKARSKTLVDMANQALFYYRNDFALLPLTPASRDRLTSLYRLLESSDFTETALTAAVHDTCAANSCSLKELGPDIRLTLSGSTNTPGLYEMMLTLGRDETLKRIKRALD